MESNQFGSWQHILSFNGLALLFVFLLCTLLSCGRGGVKSEHLKPNIVFILADDLGYGDLQCYGNPIIETPTINRLAKSGMRFTKYYSPSPLCAPARAAILTGRYNHRTGAVDVSSNRAIDRIALSEKTIGDYFKDAGYTTGLVGKWHNGLYDLQYHPNNRGFDHFYGFLNGIQDYWKWNLDRNGTNEPADGRYLTDVLNDGAIEFIENNKSNPFFLFLAHHVPHTPLQAPDSLVQKYISKGKGEITRDVAIIYAMIEAMDTGLGRMIDKLENLGIKGNTIIVFTSDNGAFVHGSQKRFQGPFSGSKGIVLEQGIRVPAIISWPKTIPSNRIETFPMHGCDWLPTLLGLSTVKIKPEKKIDGRNIGSILKGKRLTEPDKRYFYFQKNRYYPAKYSNAAIINGDWKVYWPGIPSTMKKEKGDNESVWHGAVNPHWEMQCDTIIPHWEDAVPIVPMLFNLEEDPSEKTNLATEYPDLVKEMTRKWDDWFSDVMADYESSWKEIKKATR